ncbi:MAG: hypothetical protein ABSD28_13465 [Tepidisphaeraceae bacterium]
MSRRALECSIRPEWTEIDFSEERKLAVKVLCGPCQKDTCPLDHRE